MIGEGGGLHRWNSLYKKRGLGVLRDNPAMECKVHDHSSRSSLRRPEKFPNHKPVGTEEEDREANLGKKSIRKDLGREHKKAKARSGHVPAQLPREIAQAKGQSALAFGFEK